MMIRETFINATKGYRFDDSEPYEPFTDDIGRLFRSLQGEYGRCTSRVYIDGADGNAIPCGWVFEKRMRYEDARGNDPARDYYTREVWINLYERADEVSRRRFPLNLAARRRVR